MQKFVWVNDGFPNFERCLQYLLRLPINNNILLRIIDSPSHDDISTLSTNKIMLTNNHVLPSAKNSNKIVEFGQSWYGMYAGAPNVVYRSPSKNFNCFINRMDPTRQSWAYQLIRRELFDQGFISFNMDISRHILNGECKPTDTPMDVFENQFQKYCAIFVNEHEVLKQIVPYKNFESERLSQIIIDSKFGIVLETYHVDNNFITFSEKIFRQLKLPRPWVMHAQKGAVDYLRKIGFDVLDDIVDHGYDEIDFTINRQSAILDQCEVLAKLDVDRCMSRLQKAANHNIALLNEFYSQWKQDIDGCVTRAMELSK